MAGTICEKNCEWGGQLSAKLAWTVLCEVQEGRYYRWGGMGICRGKKEVWQLAKFIQSYGDPNPRDGQEFLFLQASCLTWSIPLWVGLDRQQQWWSNVTLTRTEILKTRLNRAWHSTLLTQGRPEAPKIIKGHSTNPTPSPPHVRPDGITQPSFPKAPRLQGTL